MNPFDYSLAEARKAVVALISAAVLFAGFWIVFDPETVPLLTAAAVQLFLVIGVFASKNVTADDVSKALVGLETAVISAVGLVATVNPTTAETIASIIVLVVPVFFIHQTANEPKR